MELKGKKINILGDSITQGMATKVSEQVFWRIVEHRTGSYFRGYGIGGTRIARQSNDGENAQHFCNRVKDMDPDADVVLVFGGTNDYGHGDAPLGTMADRTDNTFYGACHDLCLKLLEKYPTATIVFLTPIRRRDEERLINEWGIRNVTNLEGYRQAICEVAGYYGFPVCRWDRLLGFNPNIPEVAERYMPDGLHPNIPGHVLLADCLQTFLENL